LQTVTSKQIDRYFDYVEFVDFLQKFYREQVTTPDRLHFEVNEELGATMLMMPSWGTDQFMGVKLVNVFPENKTLPSINGVYILMSRTTGEILAHFDGLSLTCKRTAAVSALAAKILRPDSLGKMLMMGTGNMSGELIKAHHSIQQFDRIGIWGRNIEKAKIKAEQLRYQGLPVEVVENKEAFANEAELISVATMADEAILFGEGLRSDVYVDLVGSYKKESREADDEVLKESMIYVDTYMAKKESGDLKIPLDKGVIKQERVLADLVEMSKKDFRKQHGNSAKVVFKSVGFAASDLACAIYLLSKIE